MNLVYSTNRDYSVHLFVSLYSFFQNNKEDSHDIFIIENDMSEEIKNKIKQLCDEYNSVVLWYGMDDVLKNLPSVKGISVTSFARLFLADILPVDAEKAIYIDCDTLINDSLKELWDFPIDNKLVGGVKDIVKPYFRNSLELSEKNDYINAGVLLINLKEWRNKNIQEKFLNCIISFNGEIPHNDQGVINYVCRDSIAILPLEYNITSGLLSLTLDKILYYFDLHSFYSEKEFEQAIKKPKIIHYTEGVYGRPWEKKTIHPFKEEYIKIIVENNLEEYIYLEKANNKQKFIGILQKYLPKKIYKIITS